MFVNRIIQNNAGRAMIVATNGSYTGPPTVMWEVFGEDISKQHVGKSYEVTVEEVVD